MIIRVEESGEHVERGDERKGMVTKSRKNMRLHEIAVSVKE